MLFCSARFSVGIAPSMLCNIFSFPHAVVPYSMQRGIPKFVETLNFNKLKVGMQVLGAVREINEIDLVVSLPNSLSGYVSLAEVSDVMADRVAEYVERGDDDDDASSSELPSLASIFSRGQLVRCVIVRLDSEGAARRIELTLRASVVNRGWSAEVVQPGTVMYGAIKSIEGVSL